ncbi:serine/threonine-protein kinase HipA [Stackebrandtia endophytica]|uniref:Serine/threonine-protein kinase HipA n=1 Tax=Stackebrandtia endophytica TaxID=1496996 RepID=A0A543AVY8_9ACTN|nr:HipA domain-containing protein [Stackebrandtia endophytica]TQL76753.1 serine/threonine-protein kinase HipA [Stackebrandtia endophytica]
MAELIVELYGRHIGTLSGTWRTFDFTATARAVEEYGIDSPLLSVVIPLTVIPTRSRKDRRQNFFRELLPEGRMLTRMAQDINVAEQDVIALLRAYGRDVAGALQIWDPEAPGEPKQPGLEPLTVHDVAEMLLNVQDNPLGNKPVGGKTSLAGVQDKIVLASTPDGWNRVIDGYPSTHILKPESGDHPTIIYDEEYGSRFARATGLAEFHTWIEVFETTPALVIERYDRSPDTPSGRIHQEDFNQALGAGGSRKYQRYGGRVSLARIAKVLSTTGNTESLERLLRMTVLSAAIGNLDMHAKNISLLHFQDGTMTLAPAYDIVPQSHLPNDGEMALAINHEYRHQSITRDHLIAEGHNWGLTNPRQLINDTLAIVLETAAKEAPHPAAHPGLTHDITRFTTNLLNNRAAGEPD